MADGKVSSDTKMDTDDVDKGVKSLKSKLGSIGGKMKDIGGKMSAGLTAPILGGLFAVTKGTQEFRQDLARLETNAKQAGVGADSIKNALTRLSGVSDETDSNIEGLSNLLAAGFKGKGMKAAVDALSGAMIKFPDTLKIESLADGLQETLATGKPMGQFGELLDRLGINTDKWAKKMQAAKKKGKGQEFILETLANTGLAQVNEAYRENNENLVKSRESSAKFRQSMAKLGDTLAPVVTKITRFATKLINFFNNLSTPVKIVIGIIIGLIAVIGPLLVLFGFMSTALGILAAAEWATIAPILLWVAAIAAAIAIIVIITILVVKNWDKIKAFTIAVWNAIKAFFVAFWNWIKGLFLKRLNLAKKIVKSAWDWIKNITSKLWDGIKSLILGIWDKIKKGAEVFGDIKDGIVSAFEMVKSKVSNIWSSIWGTIKDFINKIIGGINSMIGGLNGLSFTVPDWVPKWGGNSFGFSIPKIPKLDVGTNFVAQDGLAFLHRGEAVVPKEYNPAAGGAGGEVVIHLIQELDGEKLSEGTYRYDAVKLQELAEEKGRG